LHAHLVFVTKYRRGVFPDEHLTARQPVLAAVCADLGAAPVEFNGEDDHVHPLVEYPPTVQPSRLVGSLTGVSSRRLRQRFRLRTHRDHLWSPSSFAASCGGAPLALIRQYVEQQRRPDRTPVPGPTAYGGIGYPRAEPRGLRREKFGHRRFRGSSDGRVVRGLWRS
jgi:putative transposase